MDAFSKEIGRLIDEQVDEVELDRINAFMHNELETAQIDCLVTGTEEEREIKNSALFDALRRQALDTLLIIPPRRGMEYCELEKLSEIHAEQTLMDQLKTEGELVALIEMAIFSCASINPDETTDSKYYLITHMLHKMKPYDPKGWTAFMDSILPGEQFDRGNPHFKKALHKVYDQIAEESQARDTLATLYKQARGIVGHDDEQDGTDVALDEVIKQLFLATVELRQSMQSGSHTERIAERRETLATIAKTYDFEENDAENIIHFFERQFPFA